MSLPPNYTPKDPPLKDASNEANFDDEPIQLLIVPTHDTVSFQMGFLGAPDERAAIEGEVQIKGAKEGIWNRVTISLRTVECAFEQELELFSSDVDLWEPLRPSSLPPALLPFSLPLTEDTPQCIHFPQSSLVHYLSARLHCVDPTCSDLITTIVVHTRRYASHSSNGDLAPHPQAFTQDSPSLTQVELPRAVYQVGEHIPVYVTIPPPPSSVILEQGLRLRNVHAELIRVTKYPNGSGCVDSQPAHNFGDPSGHTDGREPSTSSSTVTGASSDTSAPTTEQYSTVETIVSRAGAACRYHNSRSIRLRLILHHSDLHPSSSSSSLPETSPQTSFEDRCATITQATILHSITFRVRVNINFMHRSTRTQRTITHVFSVVMLPPSATLPEVEEGIHRAYHKKHDQPPARTVRHAESDPSQHTYPYPNGAGPSALPSGAPPPFEEHHHDAPPPFSAPQEASSSSRLPTFLESESDVYVLPRPSEDSPTHLPLEFAGEGMAFGFFSSEQFDGQSDILERSTTPPPTMEMSSADSNLTELAELVGRPLEQAINEINQGLEDSVAVNDTLELPPPPPPPLDDPSDPPPSIDSEFRSHGIGLEDRQHALNPLPLPLHPTTESSNLSPMASEAALSHDRSTDPPPYLVQNDTDGQESVSRPPPYADFVSTV